MDKKKILKICLIMIVLIIAILLFCMIRNYTIAKNIINENVDKAINSESIYAKTTIKEGENIRETFDNYKKENKELTVNEMNNEDGTQSIITTYIDGINSTTYYATNRRLLAVEKDNLLRDYVVTTSYPDVISVEMIDRDFWDKIFNVGTIYIKGKSSSIVFSIVKDPERCFNELQEIIRKKQSEISYPNISDDERKI